MGDPPLGRCHTHGVSGSEVRGRGEPIDLDWLADEVHARAHDWAGEGITGQVHRGRPSDKPAAWVSVDRRPCTAQLIVWVSGEAELSFVQEEGMEPTSVHLKVADRSDLRDAVDELEWRVGVVPRRRADVRRQVVHSRWVSTERARDTATADDRDDWNEQCGGCWHWLALGGQLGADWGVCSNEATAFDGRVRFEHDGCSNHLASPDGFGAQRG